MVITSDWLNIEKCRPRCCEAGVGRNGLIPTPLEQGCGKDSIGATCAVLRGDDRGLFAGATLLRLVAGERLSGSK